MSKFREISIGTQRETMTRSNFRPLFWSIATDQKFIGAFGSIQVVVMIGYKKSDALFMHSDIFFGRMNTLLHGQWKCMVIGHV